MERAENLIAAAAAAVLARLSGRALFGVLAVTVVTVLAGVDVVMGPDAVSVGLFGVGPCLAAVAGSARVVAAVSVYTVAWAAVLLTSSAQHPAVSHDLRDGLAVAAVSTVSVLVAYRRQSLERAVGEAHAARRMLAAVVEWSDDAIVSTTPDGTIVTWNAGAQRMFGHSADEAVGAHLGLIAPRARALDLPATLARIARGEALDHYESRWVCKDGTVLDVSVCISALRDASGVVIGASAITRDITERKRADKARRVLAAVVESSDDAIIAKNLDGTITAWNPGAHRMYGYDADEAIGHNIAMITPPAELAELADILRRIEHGERIEHHETRRVRRDGTVLNVSVSISPVRDAAGTVVGASAITHDITGRKQAEADRRDLEERSQQAQRLQSLGQLAGGIAHDFNNLLAIILNYSTFIIEQSAEGSAVRADAEKIQVAGERGTALTRQLLVFARGEPTRTEVFDLNTVVDEVQNLLEHTLGAHIRLLTRPAPGPVLIDADPGQLHQVLLNLAINARDAMPDGGTLLIEVTTTLIDESADLRPALPAGAYARLLVSDTGIGMSAEVTRHILEPFFTTKPKGHGTGLGLAAVYGIVTQAGGGLNIYSEINLGTTIRTYFPLADTPAPAPDVRPPGQPSHGAGQTVVVVEDEDALRHMVERILTTNGYTVRTARDGVEALALLAEDLCDLLLTDMVMPRMSGRELARHVHQLYPDLPVLYMSGYSDGQLTDQHLLDEGTHLLQKPFTANDLLCTIRTRIVAPSPLARTAHGADTVAPPAMEGSDVRRR